MPGEYFLSEKGCYLDHDKIPVAKSHSFSCKDMTSGYNFFLKSFEGFYAPEVAVTCYLSQFR